MVQSPATDGQDVIGAMAQSILTNNEEEKAYQGLTLLLKLVSNIIKNPTEDKYRRFKKTNAKISASILSLQGGIAELITALGFTDQGEQYEFSGQIPALNKGNKSVETVIEPLRVARMTPEERTKHELIQQQQRAYQAEQARKKALVEEAKRMQRADRAEKSTEEVKASVQNRLNFGANTVVFKPPVSK